MIKQHSVYKISEKLPKHDQLVLVKKRGFDPFICTFQVWLDKINWFSAGHLIEIEKTDKWIPVLNKYF